MKNLVCSGLGESEQGEETMYIHPFLAGIIFIFAGIGLIAVVLGGILVIIPRKQSLNKEFLKKYKSIDMEYR